MMSKGNQPAHELPGAPAAAAAARRKGVGGDEDTQRSAHRLTSLLRRALKTLQCAAQLKSRTTRARAASPMRRRSVPSASVWSAASSARGSRGSYSRPSRLCSTRRVNLGRAGATTGKTDCHVLEQLERRPVEAELKRPRAAWDRTARRRCLPMRAFQADRHAARHR